MRYALTGTFAFFSLSLKGLPVSDRHQDGYLPIHRVCWGDKKNHALTARQLIVQGNEDVNARSDDGLTPLLIAASAGMPLSLFL